MNLQVKPAFFSACRLRNLLLICLTIIFSAPALADVKVEATGPYLVGEYKLPASIDLAVTPDIATELWAAVYRPIRRGHYPLLVFLHGNHFTCGRYDAALGIRVDDRGAYTTSGTCPEGYQPTPNHRGYDYLAAELAAMGYVVVSINANRGVNVADGVKGDEGLNLRRGRLVLRHLQQLASWNAGRADTPGSLGFSLRGIIDFDHVGLLGHSRGGEGMRAALAQYRDLGSLWPWRIGKVNFEAIFEIGPVDGQTSRTLNAEGVAWSVLLPACDGDVRDLQGVAPFDRMIMRSSESQAFPKSTIKVFGANHNFYNTEWQKSDSKACPGQPKLFPAYGGSEQQRRTALETVIPFFRAHVGPAKLSTLAERFDPSKSLPAELRSVTLYARGHSASLQKAANFMVDDFTRRAGTSSRGASNAPYLLDEYRHGDAGNSHDFAQRAATVAWRSKDAYLQVNASSKSVSLTPGAFNSLEFRVKLECHDALCERDINPAGDVDFSIRLTNGDGRLSSPVKLSAAARLYRPVGAYAGRENSVFQTVRIPIASFQGADMKQFRGVRFSFDETPSGRISLGNVRLVQAAAGSPGLLGVAAAVRQARQPTQLEERVGEKNEIVSVRRRAAGREAGASAGVAVVEIELASTRAFGATDSLPELYIGDKRFRLSRFSGGRPDRLVFSIDEEEYRGLPSNAEVRLRVGGAPVWNFGTFRKP